MENYSAWISFFFAHYESLSRGGGTVSLRLSRLKAKTQQALSGAAERFTSESLNRDRALLTPSACTVYSSSAGKHQHHQAVQAERQTESHVFVCVERLFFFYCWHTQREFVFRKWYILPGITSRFEMTNNPEFPYNTGSYIVAYIQN